MTTIKTTLIEMYVADSDSDSLRNFINDKTGFEEGNPFHGVKAVRDYFTLAEMEAMFGIGNDHGLTQEILDEMAEAVILNGWNIHRGVRE